jgi:hypothetical protein
VARNRPQRQLHAAARQVHSDVERGQTRAEHQDGFPGADDVERSADPRIANVALRRIEVGALRRRVRRRVVPQRQHDPVDAPLRAIGEGQAGASRVGLDVDDLSDDALEDSGIRDTFGLAQQKLQVLAVDAPRDVGLGRGRGVAAPRPPEKVLGIVGQTAHPARGDVQDVRLEARAVSHAPAQRSEPVYERDPDGTPATQKLRGHRHAAEPSAHDGDRERGGRFPRVDESQGSAHGGDSTWTLEVFGSESSSTATGTSY